MSSTVKVDNLQTRSGAGSIQMPSGVGLQLDGATKNFTLKNVSDSIGLYNHSGTKIQETNDSGVMSIHNGNITFKGPNHDFTVKALNQPISGTTNSTNDDANSDQLAIYNGSTKLWGITEDGYVLNPTKPYFNVYKDDTTSFTSSTDIIWNQVKYNVTGSYNTSNGRFTAPISGIYFFCFNVLHRGTSYVKGGYQINDTDFYAGTASEFYVDGGNANAHSHVTIPMILELSAGDYVTVEVYRSGGDLYFGGNAHNNWIGYLLG